MVLCHQGPTWSFLQIGGNKSQYDEFKARTLWRLSNALRPRSRNWPIPQFKATAKLSGFLEQQYPRKF
jgi:hypothetical protein